MKKIYILVLVFFFSFITLKSSGIENLAKKTAGGILGFFKNNVNSKFSIISMKNSSDLDEVQVQKFYQLLISVIENEAGIIFKDNLVGTGKDYFSFDTRGLSSMQYLVSIKLLNSKNKIGVGISIFSRKFDRIVSVKYYESKFSRGEKLYLKHVNYSFKKSGFFKTYELNTGKNFLDVSSLSNNKNKAASNKLLLFYTDKIVVYRMANRSIEKIYSKKIDWKRPYYIPQKFEGICSVFSHNNSQYVSVGGNFSKRSFLFEFNEQKNTLIEVGKMDFIPIETTLINGKRHLIGVKYSPAGNFFYGNIYFLNIESGISLNKVILIKKIDDFYSISFRKDVNGLINISILDKSYKIRIFDSTGNTLFHSKNQYGYSHSTLNNKWMITTIFSRKTDGLNFYRVGDLSGDPVYESRIKYQIDSVKEGNFLKMNGIWVKIFEPGNISKTKIQFWSKSIETN